MEAFISPSKSSLLLPLLFLLILVSQTAEGSKARLESIQIYRSGLDQPSDIAVSQDGRFYILDGSHHRVVVLSEQGKRLYTFGKKGGGEGELNSPMALAIEGNRVFIADTGNHRLAVFELRGWFVKNIPLISQSKSAGLPEPSGLVVEDDVVTWSDRKNHQLCQTNLITKQAAICWGRRGELKAEFQFPFHIASDRDGYLHVVDVLNGRVQIFNRKGRYFTQVSRFGVAPGELYRPNGITFADDGRMFISDSYRGTISIFKNGRFTGLLSVDGNTAVSFKSPVGLNWFKGHLYIVDVIDNAIKVVETTSAKSSVLLPGNITSGKNKTSRKNCDICHFSWAEEARTEQKQQDGVLPVASQNMCYSCHHGAVIDSRHAIGRGEQHPDIHHKTNHKKNNTTQSKDKISAQFPLLADKQLSCGSCHTPHTSGIDEAETLYESHANPWLRVLNNEGDLCQKCHQSKLDSALDENFPLTGVNHPVGIYLKEPPAVDSKAYASTDKLQKGLPAELKNAGASTGSQLQMLCQSCHQIHGAESKSLLISGFNNNELCKSCHENLHSENKEQAREKGIHPVNIKIDEAVEIDGKKIKQVTCQVCHSVHNGREDSKLLTRSTDDVEKLCSTCHQRHHAEDEKEARKKGVHVVNVELEKPVEIDGKEISKVTCLSCHSVHGGKSGTPVLHEEYKNGELCSNCHEGNNAVYNTDHDLRITAEHSLNKLEQTTQQAGVCGSCHSMHQAKTDDNFLFSASSLPYKGKEETFKRDQMCLDCHHEKGSAKDSLVKYFDHPSKDLVLRSDPEIMPLLDEHEKIAEFGAIACITCHEPHHWESTYEGADSSILQGKGSNQQGNVLNSFLRRKGITGTFCIDCHGIETQIKYKYYHDKLSRDIGVDYID